MQAPDPGAPEPTGPAVADYPIEVTPPDIGAHAAGNCGIPYIHSFAGAAAGPHVMVNALTHGNEICGAIVLNELLALGLRPRRGRLTLAFANVQAYETFDTSKPYASRFVDEDFNRIWSAAVLQDRTLDSVELRRARAMQPVVDSVDILLDLHSMHETGPPLLVCGPLDKGIELARRLGSPATICCDAGHPTGPRLRDYAGFCDPASPKNALLIEGGQHWAASSVAVCKDSTARFLSMTGTIDRKDLPLAWFAAEPGPTRLVRSRQTVVAPSMNCRFAAPYTGLETFPEEGAVVAWIDGEPVRTPFPDAVLIQPSLRQLRPGETILRFGQYE